MLRANNHKELTPTDTPVSREMTVNEIISCLVAHGCWNLTNGVDPATLIRWLAAKLLDGSGVHSEAYDVYAPAMIIFQILAGVLPYDGKTTFVIMNLVVNEKRPPERPKEIAFGREDGDKLWGLLLDCWSFEPKARPSARKVKDIMKTVTQAGLSPLDILRERLHRGFHKPPPKRPEYSNQSILSVLYLSVKGVISSCSAAKSIGGLRGLPGPNPDLFKKALELLFLSSRVMSILTQPYV
ncbi:hypothetical protein B0J17DRAFT_723855 [Rhizoctonia solani]|nr:hypothetical protein B0J17DRAFT_723855 [Rhizoctonia solani]